MAELLETITPQRVKLIESAEGANGRKYVKFEAEIQRADVRNRNGRVYPKAHLKREVDRYKKRIEERTALMGEGDHPAGAPSVSRTAVMWEDVWMNEDGRVIGRAKIIPTAVGKDLQAIIEADGTIGISSRARGSTTTKNFQGSQAEVVNEDLELLTFDVVTDPSVATARPSRVFLESFSAGEDRAATGAIMDAKEALAQIKTAAELKSNAPALYESVVREVAASVRQRMEPEFKRLVEENTTKRLTEARASGTMISPADAAKNAALTEATKVFTAALEKAGLISTLPPSDKALAEANAALTAEVARLNEENDRLANALNESTDVIEAHVLRESVRMAAAKNTAVVGHALKDDIINRALAETTKPSEANQRLDESVAYFDGLSKKLMPAPAAPTGRPAGQAARQLSAKAAISGEVAPIAQAKTRLDESAAAKNDEAGRVNLKTLIG